MYSYLPSTRRLCFCPSLVGRIMQKPNDTQWENVKRAEGEANDQFVVDLDKGADGEILSLFIHISGHVSGTNTLMLTRKFRRVGIYEGGFI